MSMHNSNGDGAGEGGGRILPALTMAATVLFAALRLGAGAGLPHVSVFLFMAGYVVFLPGWLFARRLFPGARGVWRALVAALLGAALSFAILLVLAIFRLDAALLGWIVAPVVVFFSWPGGMRQRSDALPDIRFVDASILLAAILAAVIFVIARGDPLLYTSDSADHLAYTRAVARTGEVFPDTFYYADGGIETRDIRKGIGHALWGALNRMAGRRDMLPVWPAVSSIASAILLLAAFGAGTLLSGRSSIGAIAAVLALFFLDGGLRGNALFTNAYGYAFGRGWYLLFLGFLVRWTRRGGRENLLLAAASLLVAAWTHVAHAASAAFFFAVCIPICAWSPPPGGRRPAFRRLALFAAIAAATNLPYLVMRLARDYAPANPIHTHTQGVLLFADRLTVMNPVVLFRATGPLGLLALIAAVLLWRQSRNNLSLRLLLATTIAFHAVVFCPLLFPPLFSRLSYLLIRIGFAAPPVIVCAWLLRELWKKTRGRNPLLGAPAATVGLLFAALLLLPHLARTPGDLSRSGTRRGFRDLGDLYERIQALPPGSSVAADPVTSFGIPAFTDQFAVCPFDQHATPNDATAPARIAAMRSIFAPGSGAPEAAAAMRRFGAAYLAVNGRLPRGIETMYWKPDQTGAERLAAVLDRSDCFERLWAADGAWLYALAGACPPASGGEQAPAATVPAAPGTGVASGVPGIRILSVDLAEGASRGDTLGASIRWTADEPPGARGWVAYLRFDAPFPRGPLYREWYGKIYRKIVERIEGRRYRFRVQYQPRGGLVPPDEWPPGGVVGERVLFRVPADIAPGRYAVSLRLAEKTQFFNYRIGDLLRNDDCFSGPPLDSLTIR